MSSAPFPMPAPSTPSPSPRKGVRARMTSMGTIMRRGSSFLIPSRPGTPAARASSEDLSSSTAQSVSSSPGKSGIPFLSRKSTSRPASIRSVDISAPVLAAPEDQPAQVDQPPVPQVKKDESVMLDEPVQVSPAPAPVPVSEPEAPESEPISAPAPAEEVKPQEVQDASPNPEVTPEAASEPVPAPASVTESDYEHPHEPQAPVVAAHISQTPQELSREPSENESETNSALLMTESPKALPPQLPPVNTSNDDLGIPHELSPIAEDERSAVEDRRIQFGQIPPPIAVASSTSSAPAGPGANMGRVGLAPSAAAAQAPAVTVTTATAAPTMGRAVSAGASSGGPTPRAVPIALVSESKALEKAMEAREERMRAQHENGDAIEREPTLPEYTKGKEREQSVPEENATSAPVPSSAFAPVVPIVYSVPAPQDSYFVQPAPAPVPAPLAVPTMPVAQPAQHYDIEDPFRDPEPLPEESYVVEPEPGKGMPEPVPYNSATSSVPVSMPLPPLNQVTSGKLRNVPSDYTLGGHSSRAPSTHHEVETDETLPLLGGLKAGNNQPGWVHHQPTFQSYGWEAYTLPDSTTYYAHAGKRVTTDISLKDSRKLTALTAYLDKKHSSDPRVEREGLETWLHDHEEERTGALPMDFVLVRCWVDHQKRQLGYWPPPREEEQSRISEHDQLEAEVKYWAFMETHPMHASLPVNALSEAVDALTWSYTDRLLKSQRRVTPPFTQLESHELLDVLRSTSGTESTVQAAVQTKIVSRVHRRTAQWKLHTHHPEKLHHHHSSSAHAEFPPHSQVSQQRHIKPKPQPFKNFFIATLCLGIPYLFANRHAYHHFDPEGGLVRSAGPMLIVGAGVCIVAAIILAASITFLALPGLDQAGRSAGFVTVSISVASLLSSILAAFRNQVEVQRLAARGGEGFVVMMDGVNDVSIIPSLPAVFLAWSLVSFVTGIVLYAFRGSVLVDTSHWVRFAAYTRWTTIGVCGFLAGVLLVSMIFIRH